MVKLNGNSKFGHVLFADDVIEFARFVNVLEEMVAATVKQATKDGRIISWAQVRGEVCANQQRS